MNKKVVIASLLHDIGKLIQRATGERLGHDIIGKNYLSKRGFDEEILDAVLNHHKKQLTVAKKVSNDFLTYLVYESDNLSAAHDRKENIAKNVDKNGKVIHL